MSHSCQNCEEKDTCITEFVKVLLLLCDAGLRQLQNVYFLYVSLLTPDLHGHDTVKTSSVNSKLGQNNFTGYFISPQSIYFRTVSRV